MKENSREENVKIVENLLSNAHVDYEEYKEYVIGDISFNAIKNILSDYKRVLKENEELKKYDIRNIKIDKDKIIRSPNFTRKEVDLMNLGIALNLNADKLFNEESEEDDI